MSYKKNQDLKKRAFFILSLILHIIVLILLFFFYRYTQKDIVIKKPQKQAKLLFKKKPQPPKPKPITKPKPKPKPKVNLPAFSGVRKPAATPSKPPQETPAQKTIQKPEPPEQAKPKSEPPKPPKEEKKLESKPDKEPTVAQTPSEPEKTPINKLKTGLIKKTTPQPVSKPEPAKIEPKPALPLPKTQATQTTNATKTAHKPITLTDLSKGFLDYSQKYGANLIQYTKSAQGMPTEEQLKHERYISRVFSCIETTLKIKKNTLNLIHPVTPSEMLIVDMHIVLHTDGKIANLSVAKSSGIFEFDHFMLRLIQDASSSFPPVPRYLSEDTYYLPVKFYIPAGMVMARREVY